MTGADDVLGAGDGSGDDVHAHFQAHPGHAEGVGDAALVIDDKFLGQDVDDLPVQRDGHGLGRVDHPLDVPGADLAAFDGDDPVAVKAFDVAAGNAGVDRANFATGHEFGLFEGLLDRLDGLLDIDHHALAQARGGAGTNAHHIHAFGRDFADDHTNFGGADIESDDKFRPGHTNPLPERFLSWHWPRPRAVLRQTRANFIDKMPSPLGFRPAVWKRPPLPRTPRRGPQILPFTIKKTTL